MSTRDHQGPIRPGRRRVLVLAGGLGILGLFARWPWRPSRTLAEERVLSLHEARFYRAQDGEC
jgi:hypothetical protein